MDADKVNNEEKLNEELNMLKQEATKKNKIIKLLIDRMRELQNLIDLMKPQ